MSHLARRERYTRHAPIETQARRLESLAAFLRDDGRPGHALAAENVARQLREIEFAGRPALRIL